ncbi:MAG TPA: DegT/DnrJ/EryC1/StrS family aminotransferase [Streptosporangiaceae bacterium]|jgi:dTDP-4-amino-4,6-dideoxygalactose transaminase
MNVPFNITSFAEDTSEAVVKVLDSGWVTTGPQTAGFEQDFADFLGTGSVSTPTATPRHPHVIAVASCTTALELCLRALDLPPGSRVLTPSLTFCGAVNAILHAGHQPVFVDIDEETLTPSPETVARAGTSQAMIVQHQGGYPVDVTALAQAAGLDRTKVIEDAAHGPGAERDGAPVGATSYAACYSFYATKNMPIGEGGAVATTDQELADRVRAMRLHGMSKDSWRRYLPGGSWRYDVKEIGLKANMTDIQAAIGRSQLRALPEWQRRRAEIVARYDEAFRDLDGVVLPQRSIADRPGAAHAWHLYQVRVPRRDEIIGELAAAEISTSVHFIPAHQMTAYQHLAEPGSLPVTDRVGEELLSLPLYPSLSTDAQDRVIAALTTVLRS